MQAATETDTSVEPVHPAVGVIIEKLQEIADNARYSADAREPAAQIANVLIEYFKTPD